MPLHTSAAAFSEEGGGLSQHTLTCAFESANRLRIPGS